jgi:hypothetical protein
MKLAVLGIGSVRCAPAVIASLAGYFGERPLDIVFWDSDFERLDLFDRFARLCFHLTKSKHTLVSTDESDEILENANALLLTVGENCAVKFLKGRGSLLGHGETPAVLVQRCVTELLQDAPLDASILSLVDVEPDGHPWTHATWPQEPTAGERQAVPHQVLRYLSGDEYPHALIKLYAASPLTKWLDDISRS